MKNIFYAILLFSVAFSTSCDLGDEPEIGGVEIQEMCGEWWVTLDLDGVEDVYGWGYGLISTYNTSANSNTEMWLDDSDDLWIFKVKTPVSLTSKTFGGTGLISVIPDYNISVNVSDGQITENGATTTGGNTADAIYFKVEFEDDPGTIYEIKGYKRTGFLEDEH